VARPTRRASFPGIEPDESHADARSSSEDESSSEEEAEEPQGQPKLDANGETMRDKLGNIILEDAAPAGEVSRQERKAMKAASKGKSVSIQEPAKDDDDEEGEADKLERLDNANSRKAVKVKELSAPKEGMSRREREEKEKAEAKARYDKAHAAGSAFPLSGEGMSLWLGAETDQAKADMARLRKIREERDKAACVRCSRLDSNLIVYAAQSRRPKLTVSLASQSDECLLIPRRALQSPASLIGRLGPPQDAALILFDISRAIDRYSQSTSAVVQHALNGTAMCIDPVRPQKRPGR
jgi:hypothetical protein